MGITTNDCVTNDEFFMQLALEQARLAEEVGEVPVGCVIVKDEQVIASGHNLQISEDNPTAHAEIITLQRAGKALKNYRLSDTTMYVTLEPCTMCFGAIIHARISRLVFATNDSKTGVCGSCIDLPKTTCYNHHVVIERGILEEESKRLLQNFFKKKRQKN